MSLRFDPHTGHFRDHNDHIHYNPYGPALPPGTPVIVSMSGGFGSSALQKAFNDARLNDAIVKSIQERQQKASGQFNFEAKVAKNDLEGFLEDFSRKEQYVKANCDSFDRMSLGLKFLHEKGLFDQMIPQFNSAASLRERKEILESVIATHQEAFDTFYTNIINTKYQELKALESSIERDYSPTSSESESASESGSESGETSDFSEEIQEVTSPSEQNVFKNLDDHQSKSGPRKPKCLIS